jgi:hypothetical protein
MMIKRISLGNPTIVRREVKFPSGKVVMITRGAGYVTADKEELDFLRTLKGLQIRDVEDREIKVFLSKLPDIPTVDKVITKEEARKHLWHDEDEDYVLSVLKDNGLINEETGTDPENIKQAKLKLRFGKITDTDILGEIDRRSKEGVLSDVLKNTIKCTTENAMPQNETSDTKIEITEEMVISKMKEFGYVGWRKGKGAS